MKVNITDVQKNWAQMSDLRFAQIQRQDLAAHLQPLYDSEVARRRAAGAQETLEINATELGSTSAREPQEIVKVSGYTANLGTRIGILISGDDVLIVNGPPPNKKPPEFWRFTIASLIFFWPAAIMAWIKYKDRGSDFNRRAAWKEFLEDDVQALRQNPMCTVVKRPTTTTAKPWLNMPTTGLRLLAIKVGRHTVKIQRPQEDSETIRRVCALLGDPIRD